MAMPHLRGDDLERRAAAPGCAAFIAIGQTVEGPARSRRSGLSHGGLPLSESRPFLIVDPQDAASAVRPPKELSEGRFRSRRELFEKLLAQEPFIGYGGDFQRESLVSRDAADRLLRSPSAKAFDLSLEPEEELSTPTIRDARQAACGAPARRSGRALRGGHVGVHSLPLLGQPRERSRARRRDKKLIDAPIAQLVPDLDDRGLLDRTLVVWPASSARDG